MTSTRATGSIDDAADLVRPAPLADGRPWSIRRFAPLDGLRAVAVVMVFGNHLAGRYLLPGGWLGVDLFFALSGFLITSLLLAEWSRCGRIDLRSFYMRRFLRLVPALVALVVVVAPIAWLLGHRGAFTSGLVALTYLMDVYKPIVGVDNIFGHTWSLAIEEQFYLAWPVVLVLAVKARAMRGVVVFVLVVASTIAGAIMADTTSVSAAYSGPFAHLPVILAGVGLALAVHQRRVWVARLRGGAVPVVVTTLAVAALPLLGLDHLWLYRGGLAAIGLAFAFLVGHLCIQPSGVAARLLSARPLVWLGERSYGFYLWHFPITWGAHASGLNRPAAGLVALVLSLAATASSWTLVERPFLQVKRRFAVVTEPRTGETS